MDLTLTADQAALVEAVDALLARHAGPARARSRGGLAPQYDHQLEAALGDAGFLDLARGPDAGPLEAALVVEAVAASPGVVAAGARALVAPALLPDRVRSPIALVVAGDGRPVRYGTEAATVLIADERRGDVVVTETFDTEPADMPYGYPMARLIPRGGAALGSGSAARMLAWWRVALAAEAAGTMRAALALTVSYVTHRRQFGRPVGSFQALQHRLAEAAILVEGCRLLALEAAWLGAPEEAAAVAAAHASMAAARVAAETHQVTGAIGLTTEYDLHLWTMRLQVLRLELGGMAAHARASAGRWQVPTS